MSRKRCHRRPWHTLPPRGLRPKLTRDQITDLAMVHIQNFHSIARGGANEDVMWQTMGGVMTWMFVAGVLELGEPEMRVQHGVMLAVVERWTRTGKVGFTGPEYQLAKEGVEVMDELARLVDVPTAVAAAEWSVLHLQEIVARYQAAAVAPA